MHVKSRSPYWLSPGVDVATKENLPMSSWRRALRGCYVEWDGFGSGGFAPTPEFMAKSPPWRIDVLDDLIADMQCTRSHALIEWFRVLQELRPDLPLANQIKAFGTICAERGIAWPEELEAILVLDHQFRRQAL